MNVARAKLDLIKPEEVNMDEYEVSQEVLWAFSSSFTSETECCTVAVTGLDTPAHSAVFVFTTQVRCVPS